MQEMEVYFDNEGEIRLLDPKVFDTTSQVSSGCGEFVEDLKQMNSTMDIFLKHFNEFAKQVDTMKLQALGVKNLIDMEKSSRKNKETELKLEVTMVEKDVDRLTEELESLKRIETEQKRK